MRRHVFIALCLLLVACASEPEKDAGSDLDRFEWLVGNWRGEHSGAGAFYESWTREDDVMMGVGYQVVDGDTTFGERLRLESTDGKFFYVADVSHNDSEVAFALVDHSAKHGIFENLDHDFPQRIAYTLRGDGVLYVRASLVQEAEGRVLEFFFKRSE